MSEYVKSKLQAYYAGLSASQESWDGLLKKPNVRDSSRGYYLVPISQRDWVLIYKKRIGMRYNVILTSGYLYDDSLYTCSCIPVNHAEVKSKFELEEIFNEAS